MTHTRFRLLLYNFRLDVRGKYVLLLVVNGFEQTSQGGV